MNFIQKNNEIEILHNFDKIPKKDLSKLGVDLVGDNISAEEFIVCPTDKIIYIFPKNTPPEVLIEFFDKKTISPDFQYYFAMKRFKTGGIYKIAYDMEREFFSNFLESLHRNITSSNNTYKEEIEYIRFYHDKITKSLGRYNIKIESICGCDYFGFLQQYESSIITCVNKDKFVIIKEILGINAPDKGDYLSDDNKDNNQDEPEIKLPANFENRAQLRLSFTISQQQLEKIDAVATAMDLSRNAWLKLVIRSYLDECPNETPAVFAAFPPGESILLRAKPELAERVGRAVKVSSPKITRSDWIRRVLHRSLQERPYVLISNLEPS